jgi:cell division protein FtsB
MDGRRGERTAAHVDGWEPDGEIEEAEEEPEEEPEEDEEELEEELEEPGGPWQWAGRRGVLVRRLALLLVAGTAVLPLAYPYTQWREQEADLARLRTHNAAEERRIAELRAEVSRWADPRYVEEQARQRLRWARKGEALLIVVGKDK